MTLTSATWIILLLWTLCVLICHRHLQTVAGLKVIDHLHRLMVCTLAGHLPHPTGKGVLLISLTICVASILRLRMIWMITA